MVQSREAAVAHRERTLLEERARLSYTVVPAKQKAAAWSLGAVANVVGFCTLLAVFGLMALLLPKPERSEIEKRDLASMPAFTAEALRSGRYAQEIDLYVADTFPGRDLLMALAHAADELRGVRPGEARIYSPAGSSPSPDPQPAVKPPNPSTEVPPESSSTEGSQGGAGRLPPGQDDSSSQSEAVSLGDGEQESQSAYTMDGIFIDRDRAMMLFGGTKAMSDYYAQTLNGYQDRLAGVTVYNMVVPCSTEFYMPRGYQQLSNSMKDNIDYIYSQLDSRIKRVDAYGQLASHSDEYIYFRTDHHWTALGAYYSYTAFCEAAGLEPVPLSRMELRRREGFVGTLYAQTGDLKLQQNPDVMDYYILPDAYTAQLFRRDSPYWPSHLDSIWGEYASMTNSYSIFLHGDWPLMRIDTEHKNGRRIAVVKESYGNAFVPYLLSHYETIFVVDQRYFQTSLMALMEENQVGELLFINNVFAANTQYHINCIARLADQYWTPPPPPGEESSGESGENEEEEE